ncbi:hypothetical protein FRC04_006778 [Tulasnella sp. 424]|nr:hypothetical protein FRC04_006778 [Tulasnella sp. 424]KAG8974329.1 hypothetical protein FRC05_007635 [Tulasnella sp. 425]
MSLTRALFNEFRPVFQMLDDPIFADPFSVVPQRRTPQTNDSNSQVSPWSKIARTPHVHLTDEADKYVVEAEVPGVPKENLDISISDNGRSLTIKGDTFSSSESASEGKGKEKEVVSESTTSEEPAPAEGTTPSESATPSNPVLTERSAATDSTAETTIAKQEEQPQARWSTRSSFARTIWLPKPVDAQKVTAHLNSGILTLEIPKLQAQAHRITVA